VTTHEGEIINLYFDGTIRTQRSKDEFENSTRYFLLKIGLISNPADIVSISAEVSSIEALVVVEIRGAVIRSKIVDRILYHPEGLCIHVNDEKNCALLTPSLTQSSSNTSENDSWSTQTTALVIAFVILVAAFIIVVVFLVHARNSRKTSQDVTTDPDELVVSGLYTNTMAQSNPDAASSRAPGSVLGAPSQVGATFSSSPKELTWDNSFDSHDKEKSVGESMETPPRVNSNSEKDVIRTLEFDSGAGSTASIEDNVYEYPVVSVNPRRTVRKDRV